MLFAAGLLFAAAATTYGQNRGQAEMVLQGYYLGGNSQRLMDTSGMAFRFKDFFPGVGFLSGSFEGYGSQNRFQTGENFLELRGAPWLGQRWTVTGGDFHAPAAIVEFPFYNIYTPEISARGVKVQATHLDRQYTFFAGEETLSAGPRVPYRILAPQTVMGASAVRKIAKRLQVGARFMQFSSSARGVAENPYLFPPGHGLELVRTFSVQSLYAPVKGLKLYAEASRPMAQGQRTLVSSLAGVAWESRAFTFRANYARQGALYFPLVGYYAGDRRGPFAEARFRPWKRLELYGSASQYRNNLERDPTIVSISSTGTSAGVSATLPWKFSGSAQLSTIQFSSQTPGEQAIASNNRQISAVLSRNIRRHSLHVNWRDLKLDMTSGRQRQRSTEFEDMVQLKHLFVGGAVRWQQANGTDRRNSVYFRGSAQTNVGRFSAFANVEMGNDLANQTIFSTNTYSTTVAGAGLRLSRDWQLQAEVFRNRLNMDLNPESIFVLQAGGAAISQVLAALSQWSLYFRLTKQIRWGGGLPTENLDQFAAREAPLVGTVEGVVRVKTLAGGSLAEGIPVSLDGQRTATTTADGHYLFTEVPEGEHDVTLAAAELPADYDPGALSKMHLLVQPRRAARADLEVLPLVSVEGKVTGPPGAIVEGILIRLVPGARYTTTATDGHFAFYNLREGDFQVVLDTRSLPENEVLRSPSSVPVAVRVGKQAAPVEFSIGGTSPQKPIRKVLELFNASSGTSQ